MTANTERRGTDGARRPAPRGRATDGHTADRYRNVGQWVLVDVRFQLLSVGPALYRGTSPVTALDVVARHVLVPRLRAAVIDGAARTSQARYGGRLWSTRVVPILGPVSKVPLAVWGRYDAAETEDLTPPPLAGAWEWRVTPPGPDQQMRTFWSPELYDVYDIPKPGSDQPGAPQWQWWEGPQWLDELILQSDRAEMLRVLDIFIHATTDALFIHRYRVRSPVTGEISNLRLSGRSYVADPGPDKWFRGISVRLDGQFEDTATEPGVQDFVEAAFAVSADPLCAVDIVYEHIYLTSQNFSDLGVALPPHRHLPEMCHPDDLPPLRNFLQEAAAHPGQQAGPLLVRLATPAGGWKQVIFTAAGVRLSASTQQYVLCRVVVAGDGLRG